MYNVITHILVMRELQKLLETFFSHIVAIIINAY